MATGLKTLIRLHEWTVDERRRELGVMLRALEHLHHRIELLEAEVRQEQALAASSVDFAVNFNHYYAQAMKRRAALDRQVLQKQKEIETARENVNAAFRHLKKYERAQEIRDREEDLERTRQEQERIDEMAQQQHQRHRIEERENHDLIPE